MGVLQTHYVTLDLYYATNFATDESRDSFIQQTDKFYNITEWKYTSLVKDTITPNIEWQAELTLNKYVHDQVEWDQDDVEKELLVPRRYRMNIDPVEGPEIITTNTNIPMTEDYPFILLESRPYSEIPKSSERDFQGYYFKIHLLGFRDLNKVPTSKQAYETLFPAPIRKYGGLGTYYVDPKTIIKLKYVDPQFTGVTGTSTDYRAKYVEDLFKYIKSIDNVSINLEILQEKFLKDYEIRSITPEEDKKKKLVTRLFNKL